jgi:TonB family protein
VEPKPTVPENPKKETKQPERPKQEQRTVSAVPSAKSASAAALFNACLQAKAKYPTSKEARLQNPHGTVGVQVTLSGSTITSVTIVSSSGSPLLDQAAKAGILSSDCGALASGMPSLTGRIVY